MKELSDFASRPGAFLLRYLAYRKLSHAFILGAVVAAVLRLTWTVFIGVCVSAPAVVLAAAAEAIGIPGSSKMHGIPHQRHGLRPASVPQARGRRNGKLGDNLTPAVARSRKCRKKLAREMLSS